MISGQKSHAVNYSHFTVRDGYKFLATAKNLQGEAPIPLRYFAFKWSCVSINSVYVASFIASIIFEIQNALLRVLEHSTCRCLDSTERI
jgi:hypothetical protein